MGRDAAEDGGLIKGEGGAFIREGAEGWEEGVLRRWEAQFAKAH